MKKKVILIGIILVGFCLVIGGVVISVFPPFSDENIESKTLKDVQT